LRDRTNGSKVRHVMHGRMESPAEAAALYKKMSRRTWQEPAYGPALLGLEDLGIVLWGFPNDPRLEGIERVTQPERLREAVAGVPALVAYSAGDIASTVVKYVPGKRLVMKHRLTSAAGDVVLYSKTFAHDRGGAIFAVMRSLWERGRDDAAALASPEPLAALDGGRTLLLRGLPGTAAIATLRPEALGGRMAQAGDGIARIHTSGVDGLEPWSAAHEFENFLGVTAMLRRYDPELAPAIERLRALAEERLNLIEPVDAVPIHGAFRFTQLLSYRERLALVDFDGFRQGHPMCDVGSFAAHIHYLHAKGEIGDADRAAALENFLTAYRAHAPWGTPAAALGWYTGVILVAKHVQKCVKRLKDDGDAKMRAMLAVAEDLLAGRA
jgi:aminoglycoside phosphotransferase (APT) family kinase protein